MRLILLTGSVIGSAIFALVFSITFLSVNLVERSARSFVVSRIEKEISEHEVAGVKLKTVAEKLLWFKEKYGDEIEAAKHQLASGVRFKIEEILEKICNVGCLKSKGITITDTTDANLHQKISQLSDVSEKMTELVKT